jgi:hypothetical protein
MLLMLLLDPLWNAIKIMLSILLVSLLPALPLLWWGGRLRRAGNWKGWLVAWAGMLVMFLVWRWLLSEF